ncbi:MAG: 3-keto-5-aminohexanoate cleavage protein [Pseudomonadota bacterium]
MSVSTPLIIEASLNGMTSKADNPNVPYTDEEIVEQAIACMEAGAALIHNHTTEPVFGETGAMDAELYAKPWRRLLKLRPDAILTPTMPGGPEGTPVQTRYAHIEKMAEEGLIAQGLCDPGSMNVSVQTSEGVFAPVPLVYRNDPAESHYYMETCRRLKLGLSISIFEPGFLKFVLAHYHAGKLPPGGIIKLYFGAPSQPFGLQPTENALYAYLDMLEGCDVPWLVSTFGDDCVACGMAELAIKKGGHIQVGLEPFGGDRTPDNVTLVKEVVELAGKLGRDIATPAQAAAIMKLPTYPVSYG